MPADVVAWKNYIDPDAPRLPVFYVPQGPIPSLPTGQSYFVLCEQSLRGIIKMPLCSDADKSAGLNQKPIWYCRLLVRLPARPVGEDVEFILLGTEEPVKKDARASLYYGLYRCLVALKFTPTVPR